MNNPNQHHEDGLPRRDSDWNHETYSDIESLIRTASDFVRPSEDHRPRTLEAARARCADLRTEQKLGVFLACALLVLAIVSPGFHYLSRYRSRFQGTTAAEIQEQASIISIKANVSPQWGMFEAFSQWREDQAEGFRGSR
ncbi:hypothetical protein CA13_71720 [Planctomycetes bacterium CA13]|uniref:Uncharacterized protein n=1 Tax=Novipirellula herctigrandis TaxID=2527986 RepID=A0A5C5YP60_9BACT|nr:hypothetical protein CA13_71720 [Planctomycetes bacterium CA13]